MPEMAGGGRAWKGKPLGLTRPPSPCGWSLDAHFPDPPPAPSTGPQICALQSVKAPHVGGKGTEGLLIPQPLAAAFFPWLRGDLKLPVRPLEAWTALSAGL